MARFQPGDRVRIDERTEGRHHRVPAYAKGRVGRIERCCQAYGMPEDLAFGHDDRPRVPLYRVRLRQADLWPGYEGAAHDALDLEVFEHWLSPAEDAP